MASLGAYALNQSMGFTFAAGGPAGMGIGLGFLVAGGLIDQRVMGRVFGKGKAQAEAPRLLELETGSYGRGEPSIWAIGRQVRVPVHPLWQSSKRRENRNSSKAGTSAPQTRVIVDCALALNERLTPSMTQLIGQGMLLLFTTRNVVTVRTHEITVSQSGGRLVLTMQNTRVPDWTHKFKAACVTKLQGFVPVSGPNINTVYWKVFSVTGHSSTSPSVLTLDPYQGQSLAGLNSNAGVASSPAEVIKVLDAIVEHNWTVTTINGGIAGPGGGPSIIFVRLSAVTTIPKPREVFRPGDKIRLLGFGGTGGTLINDADNVFVGLVGDSFLEIRLAAARHPVTGAPLVIPVGSTVTCGTSTNAARVEFWEPRSFASGLFPEGFNPAAHYYPGNDVQEEDSILTDVFGIGNVGGFRGVAYQALAGMDVTSFGGGLPPQLAAMISPDPNMDWAQAFLAVCERAGLAPEFVDVSAVVQRPFDGMYLRGPVAGATVLQDMLIVSQTVTQERDGILCFSGIDELDLVQIENSSRINMLGAHVGDASNGDDEINWDEMAIEDLPTQVGVRHQDPDKYYTDGFQPFGDRYPSAPSFQNIQEINVPHIVLTEKDAYELAATTKRRAHVNSERGSMVLTACHLDLVENDLLATADRHGNSYLLRSIRRDEGTNWLVEITGVKEEVDLSVRAGIARSSAGDPPQPQVQIADVVGVVLNLPPLRDEEALTPGLLFAAAPLGGGSWAGCTIYRSTDGGLNRTQIGTLSQPSAIGLTSEVLPAGTRCESHGTTTIVWDTTTTLDVEFEYDQVPLSIVTLTESEVLDGFNWFAIIDTVTGEPEIIGVRDVVFGGNRTYTFSNLLRGLRGTRPISKAAGSRIVQVSKLSELTGRFLEIPGQSHAQQYYFVRPGSDLASTQPVGAWFEWRNCRPMPVRDITKTIGGSPFDARFSFRHWTRTTRPPGNTGPYPLDETFEEYLVTIYSPDGLTAKRTWTVTARGTGSSTIRDAWVDYTAAMQTADGYTPASNETFWIDVQQVGDFENQKGPSVLQEL